MILQNRKAMVYRPFIGIVSRICIHDHSLIAVKGVVRDVYQRGREGHMGQPTPGKSLAFNPRQPFRKINNRKGLIVHKSFCLNLLNT